MSKEKYPRPQTVQGSIQLEGKAPAFRSTIYLRVLDVSRADAPSITVSENILRDVTLGGEPQQTIAFSIEYSPEKGKRYELFVHIDADGDGKISRGDYINMVSYPISPGETASSLDVRARKIG